MLLAKLYGACHLCRELFVRESMGESMSGTVCESAMEECEFRIVKKSPKCVCKFTTSSKDPVKTTAWLGLLKML